MDKSLANLWGSNGVNASDPGTPGSMLEDGWFLGAAVSLAEYPNNIKSIFVKDK